LVFSAAKEQGKFAFPRWSVGTISTLLLIPGTARRTPTALIPVSVRRGGSSPSGAVEPRSQGGGEAAHAVRVRNTSLRAARRTASRRRDGAAAAHAGARLDGAFLLGKQKNDATPEGRKKQYSSGEWQSESVSLWQ